ncbi:hypothetical protein V1634_20305 [Plantactinospora veratri]|uniref:Uncharacterized protein n=1 Tax=Plantactinospora veratri TaxID=1436122 RepID=A0ABU7SGV7_9ACTN
MTVVEDRERPSFEDLLQILTQLDSWLDRLDPEGPRSGVAAESDLGRDDQIADPFQLSFAARHSLSYAVDHLHMLRSTLRDAGVIHMYAPYSLVRGAMENGSAAVWMLAPDSQPKRLMRRLRLATLDIANGERVKDLIGVTGPRTLNERRDRVRQVARAAGLDPKEALRHVSYSEIVTAAGSHTSIGEKQARLVWNMCSGVAHGDFWSTISVTDNVELPGAPEGIAHLHVTADVRKLALVTFFAAQMVQQAWRLFAQRSEPVAQSPA